MLEGAYVRSKDARESPGPRCACARCYRLRYATFHSGASASEPGYRLLQRFLRERLEPDLFAAARTVKLLLNDRPTPRDFLLPVHLRRFGHVNANVPLDNVTTKRGNASPRAGKSGSLGDIRPGKILYVAPRLAAGPNPTSIAPGRISGFRFVNPPPLSLPPPHL